jgi:hypothetical protein
MSSGSAVADSVTRAARKLSFGRLPPFRDRPQQFGTGGRGGLGARFHQLRATDQPPAIIVEGVRGSGKSDVLDNFQRGYRRERAWAWAEKLDARINFASVPPDPESCFLELERQLKRGSSWFRRARTPRFRLVLGHLAHERGRQPVEPPVPIVTAVLVAADAGAAAAAHAAGAPLSPKVSWFAGARRWLWWRIWPTLRLTRAARWCYHFRSTLPEVSAFPATPTGPRIDALYRGLALAMAEDIKAMHVRPWGLKVDQVAIFVDGYHRVEAQVRSRFLVDFARAARGCGAPLLLVVGCRQQRLWTKWLEESGPVRDFHTFKATDAVEIHPLNELTTEDRILELDKMGVPADLCASLAQASGGLPLALRLFGEIFGSAAASQTDWLQDVKDRIPPVPASGIDDQWVQAFCSSVAPVLMEGLSSEVRLHTRAAATLRTFDRDFLAAVLGDQFMGEAFEELVSGPLTHAWRPSTTLSVPESYRVRSFVKDHLATSVTEVEAVRRWHSKAIEYLERLLREADDDQGAALRCDVIYHRYALTPTQAQDELRALWHEYYRAQRLDNCELLLDAAKDSARLTPGHAAETLCLAGQLHIATGTLQLAERRLVDAQDCRPANRDTRAKIAAALSTVYRRRYHQEDAMAQLRILAPLTYGHPSVVFHRHWTAALVTRAEGRLEDSRRHTKAARESLAEAQASGVVTADADAARFGLGPISRRHADIARHEGDLARRSGNYPRSAELLLEAGRGYRELSDLVATAHADVAYARLLRTEGQLADAIMAAKLAVAQLSSPESNDLAGAMMAVRCLTEATLQAGDLERAATLAEQLVDADPESYPPARTMGLLILGEVARRSALTDDAGDYYEQALATATHEPLRLFERHYVRLAEGELRRMMGDADAAHRAAQATLDADPVIEHPTLAFWAHLLQARAAPEPDRFRQALDRASAMVTRLRLRDGTKPPELLALEAHRQLDWGQSMPLVVFSLP